MKEMNQLLCSCLQLWILLLVLNPSNSYKSTFLSRAVLHHYQSSSLASTTDTNRFQESYYQEYWRRVIQRKEYEVEQLLKRHQDPSDPLQMKLSYMSSESYNNITESLRRPDITSNRLHSMSVVVDVKKRSPTIPSSQNIVDFEDIGHYCSLLAQINVDGFFINLDEIDYGGSVQDLRTVSKAMKLLQKEKGLSKIPICIAKDWFIHPIQVRLLFLLIYLFCSLSNHNMLL